MFNNLIRRTRLNSFSTKNVFFRGLAQENVSSNKNTKIEKTLNKVTLLGRVGADPQKRGNEEHPVVIFSLATHTNHKYESGDFLQKTEWHRVCVFNPSLRETVYNFLKKGQRIYVTGKLNYGEITDEQGVVRSTTSIIANEIIFFS